MADNLEWKQTHRVNKSVNTSIALIHYLLNSACSEHRAQIQILLSFTALDLLWQVSEWEPGFNIQDVNDFYWNCCKSKVCLCCQSDSMILRYIVIPIDLWWKSIMVLTFRARWTLLRLEIVRGTRTRGSWSNTDSQFPYIVNETALLTMACPNIRNVLPLQKSIPQSYRSPGNKPESRIHWGPSSFCGVWRGWWGQGMWI